MTPQELLIPRVLVVAGWPKGNFIPGNILTKHGVDLYKGIDRLAEPEIFEDWEIEMFPHLFRKLHWWEFRDVSVMPEYIKVNVNGIRLPYKAILKANWVIECNEINHHGKDSSSEYWIEPSCFTPATEAEYNEYLSHFKTDK